MTQTEYNQMVRALRRFIENLAKPLAREAEIMVKARTWAGRDSEGRIFHALKPDYAEWKRSEAPDMPVLFLKDEMVNALRGKMDIEWRGNTVTPVYDTYIPEDLNKEDEYGITPGYKRWIHEERGVVRSDVSYPVIRKFSQVSKQQVKKLDTLFSEAIHEWILANIREL